MDTDNVIRIVLDDPLSENPNQRKSKAKDKKITLENYVEVPSKYLKYFKGIWVKVFSKGTGLDSGGALTVVTEDYIHLKPIAKDNVKVFSLIPSNVFFVKNDTEQYKSMQEIALDMYYISKEKKAIKECKIELKKERELLKNERFHLLKEIKDFKDIRNKVYDTVLGGNTNTVGITGSS